MVLVILRDKRRGDQHRGSALCLYLGQGDRARAGHYQIASGKAVVHVVDILTDIEVVAIFDVNALRFQQIRHPCALLAVGVDMIIFLILSGTGYQLRHGFVDTFSAERTAEGEDHGLGIIKAQASLRFIMLGRKDRGTNGVACQDKMSLVREARLRVLVGEHDAVDGFREHFIGNAGIGVLLMDHRLVTKVARGEDNGSADVAACTDTDIRIEFLDDLLRFRAGFKGIVHGLEIMQRVLRRQTALEARDDDGFDREARLFDEALFHTVAVADEQELCIRLFFFDVARDR